MSFNLREFIKKGLLDAVGKMADYQVVLNAAGWHEKGVLDEEDLAEIQTLIDVKNYVPEEVERLY
jgi:hypothetical protein